MMDSLLTHKQPRRANTNNRDTGHDRIELEPSSDRQRERAILVLFGKGVEVSSPWPALPDDAWSATCETLPGHTQVLGKLASVLAPPEPQLAALRLTARGWETAPLPAPDSSGAFGVALDLGVLPSAMTDACSRVELMHWTPHLQSVGQARRQLQKGFVPDTLVVQAFPGNRGHGASLTRTATLAAKIGRCGLDGLMQRAWATGPDLAAARGRRAQARRRRLVGAPFPCSISRPVCH
jgi:Family of unknown function (DUF5996)